MPQTVDLGWAVDVAARHVASAIQFDDRYKALTPEAGYDALAGAHPAADDGLIRDKAIELLAYDRAHRGY